jgi:hypothetical protein
MMVSLNSIYQSCRSLPFNRPLDSAELFSVSSHRLRSRIKAGIARESANAVRSDVPLMVLSDRFVLIVFRSAVLGAVVA